MISIKKATENDIPIIEDILLDVVHWLDSTGKPLWTKEQVSWQSLSRHYSIDDFYIAYLDEEAAGCMVLVDYDPGFWPDVQKGESLFLHKFAVKRSGAGKGISKTLLNFAKQECRRRNIKHLRLDCHQFRDKVRKLYESEGFVCVDERCLFGKYYTAFYVWCDEEP
ncbi:MAG TPA: GNAT family N-acetyltransferase [Clostridiaceae bacterium]|nr:GNAT family N-acetyltransferase [Clostridiaceae bacterium]